MRGSPYGLFDVFVDEQSFKRFPRHAVNRTKLTRLLRDYGRSKVLKTRQQLTITYADDAVSSILRCPPASALVRVRRWKITDKGQLALACEILYRGDVFIWDSTEDEKDSLPIVPDVRSTG
jgi:GntR family transcriptional regulator